MGKRNIAKLGWHNDTITYRYSVLMSGYRREFWYWEMVVSTRKVLLVGIAVFMGNYGTETQFFCAVLVIVFSLALGLIIMNSLFTAWCMGTIMLQWAERNAGSRVSRCLEKIDSNSAIVAILIIVPSLLYLITLSVMGACGCKCCDEKKDHREKRKLRQDRPGNSSNFEFDNKLASSRSNVRFTSKRLTLSNETGRQIFIDANMQNTRSKKLEIERKQRESHEKLMERRVRRTSSNVNMQPLEESSIPSGEVEMLNLSPATAKNKKSSRVTPATPATPTSPTQSENVKKTEVTSVETHQKELMQDLASDFMFDSGEDHDGASEEEKVFTL